MLQLILQNQASGQFAIKRLRIERNVVAARLLRVRHGDRCIAQQRLDVRTIFGKHRDADTAREEELRAPQIEGLRHRGEHTAGEFGRPLDRLGSG